MHINLVLSLYVWYSSKFKGGILLSVKGCFEPRMQWNSPLAVNTTKVFFYSLKTESSSNRKFRIKSLFQPNILFCKLPITAICLRFWTSLKYFTTTQLSAEVRFVYQVLASHRREINRCHFKYLPNKDIF